MGLKTIFYLWINIFILKYEAETQTLPWRPQHEQICNAISHTIHGHRRPGLLSHEDKYDKRSCD